MGKYLKLIRVKHYLKNTLIFFPLVFSKQVWQYNLFKTTLYAFIAFCFLSSVVYIYNDINDIDNDKKHSRKRHRPLPAGLISINKAKIIAVVLLLLICFNFLASALTVQSWLLLLVYLLLNISYSKWLKNVPVADIAVLASGFVIRLTYGSVVSAISISSWLYLTVLSMSFYLVLGKRRNEINNQELDTRKVLKKYSYAFLDKNMYMYLALTIGFYALWCVDQQTITSYGKNIIWTVPLVMLICMRYSLAVEGESDGDPIEVVFNDKFMLVLILLYAMTMFIIIYYEPLLQLILN